MEATGLRSAHSIATCGPHKICSPSHTDAAGTNTITAIYDANFNPSQVTDTLNGAGSLVATFSNYDSMGNFADSTDANGKATHFDYYQTGPSTGYLQDVIRTNGSVQEKISYTYDAMGKS
jgi:hypothetical protein